MTILVTGAAGYIGSHCVLHLLRLGYDVVGIDNMSRAGINPEVFNCFTEDFEGSFTFEEGDIADSDFMKHIVDTYDIPTVFHFAALAYVDESVKDPESYYINNVSSTLNMLQAIRHKVKNIVFSSTCATYGEPSTVMDELHPQNPLNPYGHSKLMMERILKDFSKAYGLNVCIFRYFNACGADETSIIGESHDPETHLIPLAIRALKDGKPFYIFGSDYPTPDGTCVRDFIHILDIADAHVKGMEFLERTGGCHVFNLSSETGYSVLEVFNEIKSQLNITDAEVIYSPRRDGDSSKLVGVSTRAHEQLGWYPKYDLKKILETAIAFES